jgi:glycosyltransferase involved in cell wall biosynthesis
MKTIAALQAWNNFSEYYAGKVGEIIKPKFDLTVTYNQDIPYLNTFDIVWSFFPQFPKSNNDKPDHTLDPKLVKTFWEPHEIGWDKGKVNVACSTSCYRQLLRECKDAKLAPLGIDTDIFTQKSFLDGIVTVGWAGEALNERKQFKILQSMMSTIDGVYFNPNIVKCIGGYFIGKYKTIPDMNNYYNSIDIYVCASAGEGFGLPLLEASSCGRPIITFDVGIARELKQDGAGIIIVDTFEQMKEEIIKLAVDRNRIKILGDKSRKAVMEFWKWSDVRNSWLQVFKAI